MASNNVLKLEGKFLLYKKDHYARWAKVGGLENDNIILNEEFAIKDDYVNMVGEILELTNNIYIIHNKKYIFVPFEFMALRVKTINKKKWSNSTLKN